MIPFFPLELLLQRSTLKWGQEDIPDNAFDLLGKKLEIWIEKKLKALGVDDKPLILGQVDPGAYIKGPVYVAPDAIVEWGAMICGPAIIGPKSVVRHGAYVRGQVYLGQEAVVGHTTEIKGSVIFDYGKAAHFAYVGDSILGQHVNLGAGTKLANLLFDHKKEVLYKDPKTTLRQPSGLRKFGAMLGDYAQTGCNSVLLPGAILLPHKVVYPGQTFS